jgi:hypothetical protein
MPKPIFVTFGDAQAVGNDIVDVNVPWAEIKTVGNLTTMACKTCTGFVTLRDGQALDGPFGDVPTFPPLLHDSWCPRLISLKKLAGKQ